MRRPILGHGKVRFTKDELRLINKMASGGYVLATAKAGRLRDSIKQKTFAALYPDAAANPQEDETDAR